MKSKKPAIISKSLWNAPSGSLRQHFAFLITDSWDFNISKVFFVMLTGITPRSFRKVNDLKLQDNIQLKTESPVFSRL